MGKYYSAVAHADTNAHSYSHPFTRRDTDFYDDSDRVAIRDIRLPDHYSEPNLQRRFITCAVRRIQPRPISRA